MQGSGKDDVGNGGNGQHHRCPVCGAIKRDAQDLQAHMRLLHPAAEAAARGGGTPGPKHSGPKPDGALTASSRVGDSGGSSGPVARNTSRRTLGRVLLYHNAAGQALVPPVGHQLSLKYSLMQEGVEVRCVCHAAWRKKCHPPACWLACLLVVTVLLWCSSPAPCSASRALVQPSLQAPVSPHLPLRKCLPPTAGMHHPALSFCWW